MSPFSTGLAGSPALSIPAPMVREKTVMTIDPHTDVVHWPEPSPLRPWWEAVMAPAKTAAPAVPRSPDPRNRHARNPFLHSEPPTRIAC